MSNPEKKFRAGSVAATVWKNTAKDEKGEEDREFFTVSVDRVYTDKEGKPANTNTMRVNDLPKVVAACQKAYEYLTLKEE